MYNVYMNFKFWKMMYGWLTTCDSPISETFFKYFGILQFNFGYWKKCNIYPFGWQKKSSINVAFILSGNKNISNKYLSCHTFRKEWGGELRMNADQEDHINIRKTGAGEAEGNREGRKEEGTPHRLCCHRIWPWDLFVFKSMNVRNFLFFQ